MSYLDHLYENILVHCPFCNTKHHNEDCPFRGKGSQIFLVPGDKPKRPKVNIMFNKSSLGGDWKCQILLEVMEQLGCAGSVLITEYNYPTIEAILSTGLVQGVIVGSDSASAPMHVRNILKRTGHSELPLLVPEREDLGAWDPRSTNYLSPIIQEWLDHEFGTLQDAQ